MLMVQILALVKAMVFLFTLRNELKYSDFRFLFGFNDMHGCSK